MLPFVSANFVDIAIVLNSTTIIIIIIIIIIITIIVYYRLRLVIWHAPLQAAGSSII